MSREKPSRSERRQQRHTELTDNVAEAMRRLGWLPPDDEQAVGRAESTLADPPVQLPDILRDPQAVLSPPPGGGAVVYRFGPDAEAEATLARAAREGGDIPPEIERRMRADRLAAERENDDETPDPTETS